MGRLLKQLFVDCTSAGFFNAPGSHLALLPSRLNQSPLEATIAFLLYRQVTAMIHGLFRTAGCSASSKCLNAQSSELDSQAICILQEYAGLAGLGADAQVVLRVCRARELSAFSSSLAERATSLYTDVVRSTLFINKGYVSRFARCLWFHSSDFWPRHRH